MSRLLSPILAGFLLAFVAAGAVAAQESPEPATEELVELVLFDGTRVRGRIVSEAEEFVVVESDSMGRLLIDRSQIQAVNRDIPGPTSPPGWRRDPDANSLLLTPTSETLPRGDGYYRNFLLLFNNLGIAITDDFDLSAMLAFPVSSDLQIASLGAKLRLVSREETGVGVALAASGWVVSGEKVGSLGAIVSLGNHRRSLTGAVNHGFADGGGEVFFFLGGDVQVGRGFKLLAEYGNSASALTDDTDFRGLINVGFRAFWESTSFTMTGFRPLEDTGDFLAFPLVMFSAHF
ncbi:MAG: hypothetical protein KC591_06815 [Gemmatimonadetes bacterium]|nr:hypothetical protein [Gemmatimonadota bacterium]